MTEKQPTRRTATVDRRVAVFRSAVGLSPVGDVRRPLHQGGDDAAQGQQALVDVAGLPCPPVHRSGPGERQDNVSKLWLVLPASQPLQT